MIKPLNGMLASPEATSSAKEAQLCVLPCLPMLAHLSIRPSVRLSVRPHCGRSHGRAWHSCPLPPVPWSRAPCASPLYPNTTGYPVCPRCQEGGDS